VLKRGYALVRDAAGAPLHSAAAVTSGMALEIEFGDGRVGARADGAAVHAPQPKPKRSGSGGSSGQGSLFG
jgi:exodeoxyribonuclease VII large subunit